MKSIEKLLDGIDTLIGKDNLIAKLSESRPLRIKLGVDPTRPDLTFGHMVVFNKLRQFQDLGHEAILLIGDHTATIGDPSMRSETRPELTPEEVEENSKTYLDQAFKVIDPAKTIIRRNSEWFKKMTFNDMLIIAKKMTVARMLERDDFSKRYKENVPISIVEFLYPLMQGYDSVVLQADVELGGSDQLFNLLVGRSLQREYGQSEQAVITMPLIVGLDGKRKMSKSYDNYISFNHSAREMFGRIMSIPDDVMWSYFKLLLEYSDEKIEELKSDHPMVVKKILAKTLVSKFYDSHVADAELNNFENVFSKKEIPDDMPEISWSSIGKFPAMLVDAMIHSKLFGSNNEVRRLVESGAVKVNGKQITDGKFIIENENCPYIVQSGKRIFFKIVP